MTCMGILTTYAIYKYAKNKSERRQAEELEEQNEVCDLCGYTRAQHSQDDKALCPEYS